MAMTLNEDGIVQTSDRTPSSTTSEGNLSFTVCLLSGTMQVFQEFNSDDRTYQLKARVLAWISDKEGIDEVLLQITLCTGERVIDIHQTFRDNELTDGMEITAIVSCVYWGWRFDHKFQRHYPYCIACTKMATDEHLESDDHMERTRSVQQQLDFPGRERFCTQGIQFREHDIDGAPGALVTMDWLHADFPYECND